MFKPFTGIPITNILDPTLSKLVVQVLSPRHQQKKFQVNPIKIKSQNMERNAFITKIKTKFSLQLKNFKKTLKIN